MDIRIISFVALAGLVTSVPASAKLTVLTTTPDLASIAREIGKDAVLVESIAKGTQDPHYIEAKPSFMTRASRAELVIAIGLELESAWLPSILRGARNPKVMPGSVGYLEVGPRLRPIEIPSGKLTRAEGDVHPFGNPHVLLDPLRAGDAAILIAEKLGELDGSRAPQFLAAAKSFQANLKQQAEKLQQTIRASGVKKAVTYHKTLNYFFDRFGIENAGVLEPKPGIPPTSGHTIKIIKTIKEQKVPVVLIENYFDPAITRRLQEGLPSLRIEIVPVAVDGAAHVATLPALYERLGAALTGK